MSDLGAAPRVHAAYWAMLERYGQQGWWPLPSRSGTPGFDERGYHPGLYAVPELDSERLEVVAGAVLTQNTSWVNAERALAELSSRGLLEATAILEAREAELAAAIRSSGYFNQKARKLRLVVQALRSRCGTPERRDLLEIWGVGPETADSILLYAYHLPTFVVDTYTRRLALRTGWIRGRAPYGDLQALFEASLPGEASIYGEYHALILRHAKEHCRAKPRCPGCPLLGAHCPGVEA